MVVKEAFIRWYPKAFILTAHVGGAAICIWMRRWDLLTAAFLFGVPSTLLFLDLMSGGKGIMISLIKRFI